MLIEGNGERVYASTAVWTFKEMLYGLINSWLLVTFSLVFSCFLSGTSVPGTCVPGTEVPDVIQE